MHYSYDVWQKDFNAGLVELGINGFDKHLPVYFISVRPQDPANRLEINNVFPEDPNFHLSGRYNLEVAPTKTSFIIPQIPKFINEEGKDFVTYPYN